VTALKCLVRWPGRRSHTRARRREGFHSGAEGRVRLVAEIPVLWYELARDEGRPLWVGDDGHPDPGGVERRDDHLSPELGGLRGRGVGVIGSEGHAPMRRRFGLVVGDWFPAFRSRFGSSAQIRLNPLGGGIDWRATGAHTPRSDQPTRARRTPGRTLAARRQRRGRRATRLWHSRACVASGGTRAQIRSSAASKRRQTRRAHAQPDENGAIAEAPRSRSGMR
jgi:hypothetical protein